MSKFYFINSEFSGKTERVDLCIVTERQRETYMNEMKKRGNWQFEVTFYTDDDQVDVVINGEDVFRAVFDAKEMTEAEAMTVRKFIPGVKTSFDLVETWCDNYDDCPQ